MFWVQFLHQFRTPCSVFTPRTPPHLLTLSRCRWSGELHGTHDPQPGYYYEAGSAWTGIICDAGMSYDDNLATFEGEAARVTCLTSAAEG